MLWCITRPSIIEGYEISEQSFSRDPTMNSALYALTKLQHNLQHTGNPNPPPLKNQFCNRSTGECELYMGEPGDPNAPSLQTLENCKSSCTYSFTNTHNSVCDISNPNIDKWNTILNTNPDTVLPVPMGKCPKGCVPNLNNSSISVDTTNFICSPDIWYTGTYGNLDSCKSDSDCLWCTYNCSV